MASATPIFWWRSVFAATKADWFTDLQGVLMAKSIKEFFSALLEDDDGVTLVEYGIAIGLAVTVGVVLLTNLGAEISTEIGGATAVLLTT